MMRTPTSTWPFRAAWCKAVRPPRSETLTLLSRGMITSAHLTALLAAATWRGVCQFLSLALTSAECLINTCTASYNKSRVHRGHWQIISIGWKMLHQTPELRKGKTSCPHRLATGGHSSATSKPICDKDQLSGTESNRFTFPLLG